MRKLQTLIAILFLLAVNAAFCAAPAGFEAANRLYDQGDMKGARAEYQKLVDSGTWSADLFYNLANTDYRLGDKGDAFVNYERALALEPGHAEAAENLRLLRDETGARLPRPGISARILSSLEPNRAVWLGAIGFWVILFSLLPAAFRRKPAWVPAILGAAVLTWSGITLFWNQSRGQTWIVKTSEAVARVSPADSSKPAGTLPMGSHVQLLLDRGDWLYVLLPDESRGWIARSAAEPIVLRNS